MFFLHPGGFVVPPSQNPQPQIYNAHELLHIIWFRLFPFRSPLLRESLLLSVPQGTKMFQFPWLSSLTYEFSQGLHGITHVRLPNSGISGSTPVSGFPKLIATCYALHRPLTPRNPPQALKRLINIYPQLLQTIFNCQRTIAPPGAF